MPSLILPLAPSFKDRPGKSVLPQHTLDPAGSAARPALALLSRGLRLRRRCNRGNRLCSAPDAGLPASARWEAEHRLGR